MADSKGHGEKLTRKAEQAIAALLEHPTIAEAARACGVSERSLSRWLQRSDFQKRYREAQRAIVDGAIGELQAATVKAVKTLRRNLNCGNAFAENSAAQAVLTHSLKALEMQELQARVECLEARIEDQDKKRNRGQYEG